jgi:uncharacterized protein YndB with AHSA1/START domain
MRLRIVVTVDKPLDEVFDYLSDFTTTTEWDPGTITTVRIAGNGEVGTRYLNTSTFAGRETQLTYEVEELVPNVRIALRGENRTVVAHDAMTFWPVGGGRADVRTQVIYIADFAFKGVAKVVAPLFKPAFAKLGHAAQTGLMNALANL